MLNSMTNVEENLATLRLCEQYSKKVKRLCVALIRLKEIQKKLRAALCKKVCKFKAELKLISNY